jgi:hypothetical protein
LLCFSFLFQRAKAAPLVTTGQAVQAPPLQAVAPVRRSSLGSGILVVSGWWLEVVGLLVCWFVGLLVAGCWC